MNLLDEMRSTVLRPFLADEELQGQLSKEESEIAFMDALINGPAKRQSFRVTIAARGVEAHHNVIASDSCNAALIALDMTFDDDFDGALYIQVTPLRKATANETPKVAA